MILFQNYHFKLHNYTIAFYKLGKRIFATVKIVLK